MNPRVSYRHRSYELAMAANGLVTSKQAKRAGIPAVELRKICQRGGLERVAPGVYRAPFHPLGSGYSYHEALAIVGEGAFVSGESVLAALDIGNFNPLKVEISTSSRIRKKIPQHIKVHQVSAQSAAMMEITDGIPHEPVAKVLRALASSITDEELLNAADDALARHLISHGDFAEIATEFKEQNSEMNGQAATILHSNPQKD